ncbi:hypothetical protein GUK34_10390 [Rhizobium leguminosarum]|nr:hypothetical protein [Rhizobium ruizarguesonis]
MPWRDFGHGGTSSICRPAAQAVRECAGEQAAHLIDHLKKGDMAKAADNGWLPGPLPDQARDRRGWCRVAGLPRRRIDAGRDGGECFAPSDI